VSVGVGVSGVGVWGGRGQECQAWWLGLAMQSRFNHVCHYDNC